MAQHFDGVVDRRRIRERHILRCHAACRRVLLELQQVGHFFPLLRLHLDQDFFGALFRQVGQEVGGGVRFHLFNNVGRAFGIERLHNRLLHPGLDFFQSFGRHPLIQSLKNSFPLVRRKFFDDVGNVGRVQPGKALVRNLQFHTPCRIGLNQIDEVPGY